MKPFFNSTVFKTLSILFYLSVILVMCRYAKKNCYYDMDILFYTGCVLDDGTRSIEEVHQQAYAMAKRDIGNEKFSAYTDTSKYFRTAMCQSPASFHSQLPLYRMKPLYVGILKLAHELGFSTFFFSMYLNLACYALIAIVLLVYLAKRLSFFEGYAISLCVVLLPGILDVMRNSTPDMLAALLNLLAVILFVEEKKYLSVIPFCLLVLTRPESIIFVSLFSALLLYFKPEQFSAKAVLVLLTVSVLSFAWISFSFSEYSFSLFYKHGCIGFIPDLQHPGPGLTLKEYFLGLRVFPNSLFYSDLFLIILLLVYPLFRFNDSKKVLVVIAYALLLSFIVRVLLLPDLSSRYYLGSLLVAVIIFFRQLHDARKIS